MKYLCEVCISRVGCQTYLKALDEANQDEETKSGVKKITIIYECDLFLPERPIPEEDS